MDTQVYPHMDELADAFQAEEVSIPEPPSSDLVAYLGLKMILSYLHIYIFFFIGLGHESTICDCSLTVPKTLTI